MTNRLAAGVCVLLLLLAAGSNAGSLAAGTVLERSNAAEARDLLPPEIERHYEAGEYHNPVVDFPDDRFRWDDGFVEATRRNGETLVLDEQGQPIDKTTHQRPARITGLPFPGLQRDDPDAGIKAIWNLAYAYYTGGNSHNWTMLTWLSPTRLERTTVQDVYFLYFDGQPPQYAPKENPENLLYQLLAVTTSPADLQGTAALSYRFRDPGKRDLSWAYVPALRRVRGVSPANRSDGFLGSDQSQDDGFFFDGKPEDFTWRVVDHREGMRLVDPDSIAGKVQRRALSGGGWRTVYANDKRCVGYMVQGWDGIAWAPTAAALAKRKFWIVEGVPKDKYYLYGKIELWIDDVTWQGAWNRKFSWQGQLLNTYQVVGFATAPFNDHESWWGATFGYQGSENVKANRATVSGMNGPGDDVANDRRVPLDRSFFDYQSLSRFGK